jgi:hypothetical protein
LSIVDHPRRVAARDKVLFVRHLYDVAHNLSESSRPETIFLRAQRLPVGTRTFKRIEGTPLETSSAEDLYEQFFT